MTRPLSLLRRERDLPRPSRRGMAFVCALFALAAPPIGSAGSLQPDSATGSVSAGLQPDAFHAAAGTAPPPAPAPSRTPATAVLPASKGETLPAPVQPARPHPVTPQIIPAPTSPIPRIVVTTPLTPATVGRPHVVHRQVKPHVTRVVVKDHAAPRMRLPAMVSGSFTLHSPAAAARRDLLPAAFALLAFVATSGCLLAVAARSRREELEA